MLERSINVRQAIANVAWMRACGNEVIESLASAARLETVADGITVAWRGRPADHLLVVVQGALELAMTSPEGKRHVTNRLGPGQVFGLIPILDNQPWIHDATARGASQVVRIPRETLLAAMQAHTTLSAQVVQLLCTRARRLYDTLAAQSLTTLPVRVARVLVGQLQDRDDSVVRMAQSDLADMLGISRQSLNVELQQLARAGMVELGRSRIDVRDRAALERLGGLAD